MSCRSNLYQALQLSTTNNIRRSRVRGVVWPLCGSAMGQQQRRPESVFQTRLRSCSKLWESGSGSFSNLRIRHLFRLRLLSIQLAIYSCFCSRNDHADSYYCQNWKVTPDPKEKRRILPESSPALRIRDHLWSITGWKVQLDWNCLILHLLVN